MTSRSQSAPFPPSVHTEGQWLAVSVADALLPSKAAVVGVPTSSYLPRGMFPIIDQGQEFIAGWTDNRDSVVSEGLPLVVFGDHTRCFKYVDLPFAAPARSTAQKTRQP
jgi:type I restriction enzyme S subunit